MMETSERKFYAHYITINLVLNFFFNIQIKPKFYQCLKYSNEINQVESFKCGSYCTTVHHTDHPTSSKPNHTIYFQKTKIIFQSTNKKFYLKKANHYLVAESQNASFAGRRFNELFLAGSAERDWKSYRRNTYHAV